MAVEIDSRRCTFETWRPGRVCGPGLHVDRMRMEERAFGRLRGRSKVEVFTIRDAMAAEELDGDAVEVDGGGINQQSACGRLEVVVVVVVVRVLGFGWAHYWAGLGWLLSLLKSPLLVPGRFARCPAELAPLAALPAGPARSSSYLYCLSVRYLCYICPRPGPTLVG